MLAHLGAVQGHPFAANAVVHGPDAAVIAVATPGHAYRDAILLRLLQICFQLDGLHCLGGETRLQLVP